MELEDVVVYESNVAYQTHKEFTQYKDCSREMVPTEAGNYNKNNNGFKMNTKLLRIKKLLIAMILLVVVLAAIILTAIILSTLSYGRSQANKESLIGFQLDESIQKKLISLQFQLYYGAGQWHRITFLNMTGPSQQCPPVWREYNNDRIRACGRPTISTGSCATKYYFASHQYCNSRVCGRVIGYQVVSPDAFARPYTEKIDFDGVNITRGAKRNHIWSYVAGFSESATNFNCPCSTTNSSSSPPSIGKNYYCESGNPRNTFNNNQIFPNDPLWDGQQCEGTCCNGTNSPPWFSVQLPAPTTDAIEVSICADESTDNEDTPIELLEIYIQ